MFSIIMPTYNCVNYVKASIESVMVQTFRDFQMIIVDDGSSDGTFQIIEQIAQNDPRIEYYKLDHGGVSAARNFGLSKVKHHYILFIDGDDTWDENLLNTCAEFCESYDITLFGIREDWYSGDDLVSSRNSLESAEEYPKETELTMDLFSKYNMSSPCNKVYCADIVKKFNIRFSEKCVYLEDLKFNLDYLKHVSSVFVINQDFYFYRLSVNKNQIFKRNFVKPYINADELYISMNELTLHLVNIRCVQISPMREILFNAYLREAFYYLNTKKRKDQKEYISLLNSNSVFLKLLKSITGRYIKLLKLCVTLKLFYFEKKLINRRFCLE